jgi:ATP-dependent 26S proteasome regulatory subunit
MEQVSDRLASYIRSGYVLVMLVTYEEDRALTAIGAAAAKRSQPVSVWSASAGFGDHRGPGPADAGEALARIQATPDPRVFVLLDFHHALDDSTVVRRLRDLAGKLAAKAQAVVMVTPAACVPLELEKELTIMDLPPPDRAELDRILEQCLTETGHQGRLRSDPELREAVLRAGIGLTGREIGRVLRRALQLHPDFSRAQVKEVLAEKKQVLRQTELLEFHDVEESLEEVGGLDLLKQWLNERAEAFGERARAYGLPQPKGLLLLGVQGCGKSLCAKAVSGRWGLPLIRLDLSAVLDRAGEGDHLRRALRIAEDLAPCVLWIDEVEKGFSVHRVTGAEAGGRMARAFASFLTWLQEKNNPVYVIATANSIAELPPELVRKGRFDEIFFVDLPQAAEREEIFRIHLRKRGRDPQVFNLHELGPVSEGFSGSEIEQAVIAAMYAAFTESRELDTRDVARALKATVPLSETLEEQIKALRDWAKTRARPASLDTSLMDLLNGGKGGKDN